MTNGSSTPRRSHLRTLWRTAGTAGAVALLAVTATACNADDTSAGKKPSASAAAEDGSASGEPSGPGDGSPEPAGTAAQSGAASDRCTSTDLTMDLGDPDPGAGNIRYPLTFTNKSSADCTLKGYPGASLIRADGERIGHAAEREGGGGASVELAPGESAGTALRTVNKGMKEGGCWEKPDLLKVYPPGSRESMTLRTTQPEICGDTFTVSALR